MNKLREKTTATLLIAILMISTMVVVVTVMADDDPNTVLSSTMHFEGTLTDNLDGTYSGVIPMIDEAVGPVGDGISGFDVYAKEGGIAYVEGLGTWTIGSDHDAYAAPGPWGAWYDPDCADWDKYSLELTSDRWYLRYTATGESPMSGIMMWRGEGKGYAAETDLGTVRNDDGNNPTDPLNREANRYAAGSAQEWGWDCGWGEERIPLEYSGFKVEVTGTGDYHVTLTPAPLRGPTPVTIPMHQVQIQCRRWNPAGWRYFYHDYPITWDFKSSGNVLHTTISYQPSVTDKVGASRVFVYDKKEQVWIMNEGTVQYTSPYSGLTINEHWKGYIEFDDEGNFEHGVGYQWGYVYGLDEETVKAEYPFAIWDDTMGAWNLGFSIYIWDKTSFDQSAYFTEADSDTGIWCSLCSRYEKPILTWDEVKDLEPVPKSDYNPLGE